MKRYAAIFPSLDEASFIHGVRAQHDPLSSRVAPHITLVFPTDKPTLDGLEAEVVRAVEGPFRVVLRSALAMPEGARSYVFLVPDEGFSSLMQLHDRLYAGPLGSELRLDVPFVPHLTVAAGLEHSVARGLARELNAKPFAVEVLVDAIELVEIVGEADHRVRRRAVGMLAQGDRPAEHATSAELARRAQAARDAGRYDEALRHQADAVGLCRAHEPERLPHALRHLADILFDDGQLAVAAPCYAEMLALYRARPGVPALELANALRSVACHAQATGDRARAVALWTEARDRYAEVGVEAGVDEAERRLEVLSEGCS